MWWKPKNFQESIIPMVLVYAIIGHGFYQYPVGRVRPVFSIIYAIIVTAFSIAATVKIVQLCYASPWFGNEEKIFHYVVYINYGILTITQVFNWYHVRTFRTLTARLSTVDETLQQLGVTFDYPGDMRIGLFIIGFWILLILCLNSINVLWLLNVAPMGEIIIIVLVLNHSMHINAAIAVIFSAGVRLICMRFRKLNLLLESLTKPDKRPVNVEVCRFLRSKISSTTNFTISSNRTLQTSQNYYNRKEIIQIIKHVHLELNIISKSMDRVFGIQIALEISAYFIMFIGFLYDLYIVCMNPSLERRHARAAVLIVWISVYLIQLIFINRTCENISYESHRTGEIIHRLNSEFYGDKEYPDEVRQFSMQLLLNQLVFSPGEFFVLSDGFVRAFLGSVTTYLVILVQMSGSATPAHKG